MTTPAPAVADKLLERDTRLTEQVEKLTQEIQHQVVSAA